MKIRLHGIRSINMLVCICALTGIVLLVSCSDAVKPVEDNETTNANSGMDDTAKPDALPATDPIRISGKGTIHIEYPGRVDAGSVDIPFSLTKLRGDRRVAVTLPDSPELIYIEHVGMRYFVVPSRKQYVEVTPDLIDLYFPGLNLLTTGWLVGKINSRGPVDSLGIEHVAFMRARKYRFESSIQGIKTPGTISTDAIFYIEIMSGCPVHCDITLSTPDKAAVITIEMKELYFNPTPKEFDIPIGFKKVSTMELKSQLRGFSEAAWKVIGDAMLDSLVESSESKSKREEPAGQAGMSSGFGR